MKCFGIKFKNERNFETFNLKSSLKNKNNNICIIEEGILLLDNEKLQIIKKEKKQEEEEMEEEEVEEEEEEEEQSFNINNSFLVLKKVIEIYSSINFLIIICENNEIWSYGMNCINPNIHSTTPQLELVSNNIISKQISCGYYHVLVIDNQGNSFSFGRGESGQLGNGLNLLWVDKPLPVIISHPIVFVSAGSHHSTFISDSGSLFCLWFSIIMSTWSSFVYK